MDVSLVTWRGERRRIVTSRQLNRALRRCRKRREWALSRIKRLWWNPYLVGYWLAIVIGETFAERLFIRWLEIIIEDPH